MELHTLRSFVAIVDAGTMTAAAALLHISQPALSRQISDLETELHTPLFDRAGRGLSLTPAGTYLVSRARQILALADGTAAALNQQTPLSGPLTIGLGESALNRQVIQAAAQLCREHPAVQLHLYSGNADDIFERLDRGVLDFGVVIDPADKNKYAWAPLTGRNVWGLTVPPASPLAATPAITRAVFRRTPLIISDRSPVQQMLENWLGAPLGKDQVVGRFNLIFNAAILAETGMGAVVGISHLTETVAPGLRFIPFTPELSTGMTLIWPKNTVLSPPARAFLKVFTQSSM